MNEQKGAIVLPRFLEGRPLPDGYYDPPDPYKAPPTCPYHLRALSAYAKEKGVAVTDLSREEVERFRTDNPRQEE